MLKTYVNTPDGKLKIVKQPNDNVEVMKGSKLHNPYGPAKIDRGVISFYLNGKSIGRDDWSEITGTKWVKKRATTERTKRRPYKEPTRRAPKVLKK